MIRRYGIRIVAIVAVLAIATPAWAGTLGLDRNSSDVIVDAGSLDTTGGQFVTAAPWDVNTEFQISFMGEVENPPNAEWNINHYDPGVGPYDWTNNNFADYPYYHVQINSAGTIPASFYTDGPTGDMLDWALYYTDSSGNIQTIFGGALLDPMIDGSGNFSAFLQIVPERMYLTFDGVNGDGFVNTVEVFGGVAKQTDLMGYHISQPGAVVGDTWTASGDTTLEAQLAVPEPATMLLLLGGLGGLGVYVRRRRRAA